MRKHLHQFHSTSIAPDSRKNLRGILKEFWKNPEKNPGRMAFPPRQPPMNGSDRHIHFLLLLFLLLLLLLLLPFQKEEGLPTLPATFIDSLTGFFRRALMPIPLQSSTDIIIIPRHPPASLRILHHKCFRDSSRSFRIFLRFFKIFQDPWWSFGILKDLFREVWRYFRDSSRSFRILEDILGFLRASQDPWSSFGIFEDLFREVWR